MNDKQKQDFEQGYDVGYKSGYNAAVAEFEAKKSILCLRCKKAPNLYKWSRWQKEENVK